MASSNTPLDTLASQSIDRLLLSMVNLCPRSHRPCLQVTMSSQKCAKRPELQPIWRWPSGFHHLASGTGLKQGLVFCQRLSYYICLNYCTPLVSCIEISGFTLSAHLSDTQLEQMGLYWAFLLVGILACGPRLRHLCLLINYVCLSQKLVLPCSRKQSGNSHWKMTIFHQKSGKKHLETMFLPSFLSQL